MEGLKTLRVNMDRLETTWESILPEYKRFGGRALIAKILLTEVPPRCEPLGPNNKLIFAPGLLGGTSLSSSGRLSIGGKSPLTGEVESRRPTAVGTAVPTWLALASRHWW